MNATAVKTKINPWVWTDIAQARYSDRKANTPVPTGYLMEGHKEWFPYSSWVEKGYVKRIIYK